MRRLGLVSALAALWACGPRQPAPDAAAERTPCVAVQGELEAGASAADLRGAYRLALVASSGARAGDSTAADLELVPAEDSLQAPPTALALRDSTARFPLIGWTTMDPAAVGGTDTGALESRDPSAPGVLVMEWRGPQPNAARKVMLRLGADANRRERARFDGGYFALTVRRVDATGFAGTWASAAGGPAAAGYFCARRTDG